MTQTRIALGMSGGVDSATTAAILMQMGYEVVGVTCHFKDGQSSDIAETDAAAVCKKLGIEHHIFAGTDTFKECVIDPFISSYEQGFTPSPCIVCNARCKMPSLIQAADAFGCEKIATGHYARINQLLDNKRFIVKTALDAGKDQSYMLSLLSQEQLSRLVLPLGGMTKAEVRIRAAEWDLPVAEKAESQDNCFVEGDYRDFLREAGVKLESGNIVTREGVVLGTHTGLPNYTIGQRKGIGVAALRPYYVIEKRGATNELVVGFEEETTIQGVTLIKPNWQAFETLEKPLEAMIKLRYRSTPVACIIEPMEGQLVSVKLQSPQPTTAPGQFAVAYQGSTVIGGGMIQEVWQ